MKFVSRAEWGAKPALSRSPIQATGGVAIHWEGPHMGVFPHSDCPVRVRTIQTFHMHTRKWADIAYTGLVCPHGYVYEGRWVGRRTAAQGTNDGNDRYYALCYLGGVDDPLTDEAKQAFTDAIAFLRSHGAGRDVQPHLHFHSTSCPGPELLAWIAAKGYEPVAAQTEAPPTVLLEEPDMVIIYATDRPVALLAAGRLTALTSNAEKDALHAAGIPLKKVQPGEFDLIAAVSKRSA